MNQIQILVLVEVMAYSMLPNLAQPTFKVCGPELVETLHTICGPRGIYSPPQGISRQTQATKDGIATQCCESHCEYSYLEKFCNPPTSESEVAAPQPPPPQPPQGLTSTEDERRPNRVPAPDSPVPTGNGDGSQSPEVDVSSGGQLSTTNHSKHSSTELDGEESSQGGAVGDVDDGKSDASPSGPPERGEGRSVEEDTAAARGRPTNRPTNRPNRHHHRTRSRTSKGSDRRSNSSRRKGSRENQAPTSAGRRKPRQRRKGQRPRKPNSKNRSRLDKKGTVSGKPSTTPFAAETVHQPNKNGAYNRTTGELSPVINVTNTGSASETRKDGFFTTITAVLNAIGIQQSDDGNR